jgi:serine-type D-Ala-D-Ala carboxypeptidase/endopeptidase
MCPCSLVTAIRVGGLACGPTRRTGARLGDAHGSYVCAGRHMCRRRPRPVDADTLFEIGSVTKVFTAVLLADADQRGVVKLDDSIGAPSPAGGITYRQLVTHTSGLPRMPADFTRGDLGNPYVDQDLDALARSLALHATDAKPAKCVYSNLGFAVLGAALSAAERTAWTDLVRTRVLLDSNGQVSALTLHQHGREVRAERMSL